MYIVYILRSINHLERLYIGLTTDLEKRLKAHNTDSSTYSKRFSPWELETSISMKDKRAAEELEKYLKSGSGFAFLKKRLLPQVEKGVAAFSGEETKMVANVRIDKEFEVFFNITWHARHMFRLYCKLYEESEDRIELLRRSADEFFADLQTMWQDHVLLDICKLTDSYEDGNLTIDYFVCSHKNNFSKEEDARIQEIMSSIECFRGKIKPSRHKIIAHIDKKTAVDNKSLGGLSVEEIAAGKQMCQMIEQFYDNVQEVINIVSSKMYGDSSERYLKPLDPTGNAAEEFIMLGKNWTTFERS